MNNGEARGEVWGVELSEGFGVGREVIWRHRTKRWVGNHFCVLAGRRFLPRRHDFSATGGIG